MGPCHIARNSDPQRLRRIEVPRHGASHEQAEGVVAVVIACCEYGEGGAGFFGVYLIKFEECASSGLEVAHPLERICI
jgi:hypothetical protein